MRFSPDGGVYACCVNSTHRLGHVATDRLEDVWHGERLAELRRAVARGDGSLGCRDCAYEHERDRRDATHAVLFDQFADRPSVDWPIRLEFALANTCNLTCVHCNGELSSAIRSRREGRAALPDHYGEEFFEQLGPFLDQVEVTAFLGGEPFLMRQARRVWDMLIARDRAISVHVTTNGTVWDDRVEHYVAALAMNVAISIDSIDPTTFESIRQGASFEQVMEHRDRLFELTRRHGGSFVINHCLMRQNVAQLYDFLADADHRGMSVQVIPVVFPGRHSALALGDDLNDVVAELRRRAGLDGPPGRNAAAFHEAVSYLESAIADLGDSPSAPIQSIPVGLPQRRPALLRESVRSQREFGSGADPLRVEVLDGFVESVSVPPWAEVLGASSWVGRQDGELLAGVCDRLGGEPSWQVRERWDEVTEVDLVIEGTQERSAVRVHVLDWYRGDAAGRTYLIASGDLVRRFPQ